MAHPGEIFAELADVSNQAAIVAAEIITALIGGGGAGFIGVVDDKIRFVIAGFRVGGNFGVKVPDDFFSGGKTQAEGLAGFLHLVIVGIKSGIFGKGNFNVSGIRGDGVGLFCFGDEAAPLTAAAKLFFPLGLLGFLFSTAAGVLRLQMLRGYGVQIGGGGLRGWEGGKLRRELFKAGRKAGGFLGVEVRHVAGGGALFGVA